MRLHVKALNGHVNDSVRDYAERKLGKLSKRIHELTEIDLTLSREHNPSIADDHVAEAVVHAKGPTLVAREAASTWEAAIDQLVDKLERQIERYRDKRTHEPRRSSRAAKAVADEPEASAPDGADIDSSAA